MGNEFARTELLLGSGGLSRLREASVMVLGLGGVGSHCTEALARSGVGKLILVDHDKVSISNINRQSIALHSTVGQYKSKDKGGYIRMFRAAGEYRGDFCAETGLYR